MQRILITGGMGFIGKCLVRTLLAKTDFAITVVDNLSSSRIDEALVANPRVRFVRMAFERWQPAEGERFEQIYHLTSPVGPLGVLRYKGRIADMILTQLYHAARLAIDMRAKLLEISTSEVYGRHPEDESEGQREDIDKIVPADITVRLEYGVAKLLCEIVLKNLSRENPLDYVCIRPFNIVGPKQNDELGFIIPRFLRQALRGEPLTVYGDGTQKRTFTHVQDFVDGLILAMDRGGSGEIYNLGNPANVIRIIDLASRIRAATGERSDIAFVQPETLFKDFSEAWNKIPNIEKFSRRTGWTPRYSLDDIVDEVQRLGSAYLID